MLIHNIQPRRLDDQRELVVPGDFSKTLVFCVEHWINLAKNAIKDHGAFYVALSGGSTPIAIFEQLNEPAFNQLVEWEKIHLFWSDERAVPPEHPDSNYRMAMNCAFAKLPIPKNHIHRMIAETDIEKNALNYENQMKSVLKEHPLDLVMLGMGEDGHTASLFPFTKGVNVSDRKVVANFISEKKSWRMTFTFPWINAALHSAIYVLGGSKKETLAKVLSSKDKTDLYPVLKVGTPMRPALWIADEAAAADIIAEKDSQLTLL